MILKCNCTQYLGGSTAGAIFQDERYGKGNRVHNPIVKEPKGSHWKCTICTTEHTSSKGSSDAISDKKENKKK